MPLTAAVATPDTAAACRKRLESIALPELGRKIAVVLQRLERMAPAQTQLIRDWPQGQVQLLKAAMVEACRLAEAGQSLHCRGVARLGTPRSISVELAEDGNLEIVFTGPVMQ